MDENKMIRPMDFVRLTNIDELNVIKDTKNHIGLVKEVSRDGSMSGLDGCVNSRIRQIVILFRKCLAIKEAMSYGTVF